LRLGAALGFVGKVEILEPGLGVGFADRGLQNGFELALLGDALEDRGTPLLEFAQIREPGLE
jgi:hypothetical protein